MNALTQYLDLYRSHRDMICAGSPEALNRHRDAALHMLTHIGRLPHFGDEGFVKVSLNDMFAPDYGLNLTRRRFDADAEGAFGCETPVAAGPSALVVNDAFVPGPRMAAALPEGVEVMSLAEAARLYPDDVAREIAPADNPVAALNTLFVQDGVFIRVRAGVKFDRPIQVLAIFNTSEPLMAVRRVKIFVEEGAAARVLLCDHPRVNDVDYLNCRVVEASLSRGSRLEIFDLEEATPRTSRASVTASEQAEGSTLELTNLYLHGGITRNEFIPHHLGEHCTTTVNGLVIGSGKQVIDNAVRLVHTQPRCASHQLFKYALFDSAQGSFQGTVTIRPDAPFTEAHQTDRNLLASPEARMYAMPRLIINCDEVKASHGAATGQLDSNALFYMQSRGIPEAEARMMLINAFMTDVLAKISYTPLHDRLTHLVEKRLHGCETTCAGCSLD
ncbi:MAG: SufD family Fe-S cluster assembly protein [Muribaculaceae bacterium]|nr:SufD family Fe-S cluster assembly protein [Muribaculaceae bacterium]